MSSDAMATTARAAGGGPARSRAAVLKRLRGTASLVLRYAVAAAAIGLAWELFSVRFDSPVLFPGPAKTAARAIELIEDGRLQGDILISLQRILIGFAVGSVIGALAGLAMGSSRLDRRPLPAAG